MGNRSQKAVAISSLLRDNFSIPVARRNEVATDTKSQLQALDHLALTLSSCSKLVSELYFYSPKRYFTRLRLTDPLSSSMVRSIFVVRSLSLTRPRFSNKAVGRCLGSALHLNSNQSFFARLAPNCRCTESLSVTLVAC